MTCVYKSLPIAGRIGDPFPPKPPFSLQRLLISAGRTILPRAAVPALLQMVMLLYIKLQSVVVWQGWCGLCLRNGGFVMKSRKRLEELLNEKAHKGLVLGAE